MDKFPNDPHDVRRSKKDFKGEKSPYWNWQNKRIVRSGQQELAQANPDMLEDSAHLYPAASDNVRARYEQVLEALIKLSPKEQEVIKLLLEEKTQEEIAVILNLSRGNVSTFLERARKKIKKLVG